MPAGDDHLSVILATGHPTETWLSTGYQDMDDRKSLKVQSNPKRRGAPEFGGRAQDRHLDRADRTEFANRAGVSPLSCYLTETFPLLGDG
jgi:hypothetical protein